VTDMTRDLVINLLDSRVFVTTATFGVMIEEVHTCCLIESKGWS
jgi:hypothetical protein